MSDPNLLILAGGISSRMKRSAESREDLDPHFKNEIRQKSKSMIGVGGDDRPFLDYLLYNAREAGYRDVVIVISERDSSIQEYYGKKERGNMFHGVELSYAVQTIPPGRSKPIGTADAVVQGLRVRKDWRGKKFTVCNSDNLYSIQALKILRESRYPNAMIDYDRETLGFDPSRVFSFSVTLKDADGFLTAIIEKPTPEEVERARGPSGAIGVSMNIFRLDYDTILPFVLEIPFQAVRDEKELPVAVSVMVGRIPKSMFAYPFSEVVPDLTNIDDVERVNKFIESEFRSLKW